MNNTPNDLQAIFIVGDRCCTMSFTVSNSLRNIVGGLRSTATLVHRHNRSVTRLPNQRFSSKLEMFKKRVEAEKLGRKFILSIDELKDISGLMSKAIDRGLKSADPSSVMCLNTHINYPLPPAGIMSSVATSNQFLSLELPYCDHDHFQMGWTRVSDQDKNVHRVQQSDTYPLTKYLNVCSNQELFTQLASRLKTFSDQCVGANAAGIPLAVTIGFPVRQTALDTAVLHRWTKEFDCKETIGRDFVVELRSSLKYTGLDVGPMAVFNDACALILNSTVDMPGTLIGLVVGNGCNCCYVEPVANVQNHYRPKSSSSDTAAQTIVNTEWGAFGEDGELNNYKNVFDKHLDAKSRYPGKQIFEKMTAGKFENAFCLKLLHI